MEDVFVTLLLYRTSEKKNYSSIDTDDEQNAETIRGKIPKPRKSQNTNIRNDMKASKSPTFRVPFCLLSLSSVDLCK